MEISNLDKLYAWLDMVQEKQAFMKEWHTHFSYREHIDINKLEKKIKKQIRKELVNQWKTR